MLKARQDAQVAYERGLRAQELRQYATAAAHYSLALQLDPASEAAYVHRGICRLELGQLEMAIADLTKSLRIQPDNADAYFIRAKVQFAAGRYADTILDLNDAIERSSNTAAYYQLRGQAFYIRGDFSKAVTDYTAAIKLEPTAEAYRGRADVFSSLGRAELATEDRNRAAQIPPKRLPSYSSAAIIPRRQLGATRSARIHRGSSAPPPKHAPSLPPQRSVGRESLLWTYRGRSWTAQGRYRKALETLVVALEVDPQLALAYNSRGYAHLRLKLYEQAAADFSAAIKLNDKYQNAYHNRGVTRRLMGDQQGAKMDFEKEAALKRAGVVR